MIPPRGSLVVDTSVLIAAVLGRNSLALTAAASRRDLIVTTITAREAHRRIELGLKAPERLPALGAAIDIMNLVQADERHLELAAQYLRDAVASQNGSVVDAHILACAWSYDADIWSFDRDFAGTGVASWSTANLMRALAAEVPDDARD